MSTGSGSKPPSGGGSGRPAADTPQRLVVRSLDDGADALMGAHDTAVATAEDRKRSSPGKTPAPTESGETPAAGTRQFSGSVTPEIIGMTLSERYLVTRKVGQGGMGAVYEATHTLIGKRVAVKVLLEKYAQREAIIARLKQEAQLASSVGNEHIIDITDFGTTEDGRTFVVMEFLEGESMAECLARETRLPEQRILRIVQQTLSALGAAHDKGIVHRDIKPENLFLLRRKETDFVKVVDFGISKSLRTTGEDEEQVRLTQTGMVLGTPLYMSPEQARGDDELDHRVDLYALGIIMYEAATGRVPFSGNNYLSVISQVLNEEPKPMRELRPELSDEFESIVSKAMAKDRVDRYPDAAAMLADVSALIEDPTHSTERARISGPRRRLAKTKSSGKVALWIGAIALTVLALVVTVRFLMGGSSSQRIVEAPKTDAGVAAVAVDAAVKIEPDAYVDTNRYVFLDVDSLPTGASLECDGFPKGTAPTTIKFVEERKEVECWAMLDGYDSKRFVVNPLELPEEQVVIKVKKLEAGKKPAKVPTKNPEQGSATAPEQPGSRTGGETGGFVPPVTK